LISQWVDLNLQSFLNANKKEWGQPLRNLFSQWKYFYEKVCERASNRAGSMDSEKDRLLRAARALDVLREGRRMSVSQYLKNLKHHDPSTQRRPR
jgi:hypothetical protein